MTEPYYTDDHVTLWHGDCLDVLRGLPDASVDAIVTDPPYGLEFMGKDWDRPWAVTASAGVGFKGREDNLTLPSHRDGRNANCRTCGGRQRGANRCTCDSPSWDRHPREDMVAFQQWCAEWATECLRVLKPGGHLLSFGGSRTWHRLACAVEDAGFEIRDSIAWLYGSGFPKSLNVAKAIASGGGRPEDIRRLAMGDDYAPSGRGRVNYDHGAGSAMNGSHAPVEIPGAARQWQGWGTALKPAFEPIVVARKPLAGTVAANVLEHGTGALNIDACRVGTDGGGNTCPGGDECECVTSGVSFSPTKHPVRREGKFGRWPTNVVLDDATAAELDEQTGTLTSGKLEAHHARAPKDAGILGAYGSTEGERGYGDTGGASRFFPVFRYEAKADRAERPRVNGVAHPTVKPLALMQWVARLVTPPGGTVLEPFAGSGATVEACVVEGFKCVAIEREAEYLPLIEARIARRTNAARALELTGEDLGLFGLLNDTEDGAA